MDSTITDENLAEKLKKKVTSGRTSGCKSWPIDKLTNKPKENKYTVNPVPSRPSAKTS